MTPYYADEWLTVRHGDVRVELAELADESIHCVVTSPPYWGLRDYGQPGQLGLEPNPEQYVENMVAVFREVRRVLRSDGTLWLNLGDSYAGLKPKDLVGIPWRVAFALQADGWYLRSDIIWSKPNPIPESVTDRPTKSHEYLFLLAKSARYYFDADAVREPSDSTSWTRERDTASYRDGRRVQLRDKTAEIDEGATPRHRRPPVGAINPAGRNIRSVWTVATQPYPGAHFATFPPKLIEPCIKAGSPEGGIVLDPFAGSGTTGMVAQSLSRRAVLIDLNIDYLGQLMDRNAAIPLGLGEAS